MTKKTMRVGVKAAIIGGIFLVIATIIGTLVSNTFGGSKKNNQEVKNQQLDTVSMKKGDTVVKYIKTPVAKTVSSQKTNNHEQTNVTSINQSGGQTAKEITNNYK